MKKALLVIDVQNIYSLESSGLCVSNSKEVVNNINKLVEHFDKNGDLVVYIKHIHKADGSDSGRMFDFSGEQGDVEFVENSIESDFIPELKIIEKSPVVIKNRYSSFVNTNLNDLLKTHKINTVVVCGFMTNFCCEMASRHAHDLDYYVDFIVDATGTPGTEDLSPEETISATVATLKAGYANILETSEVIKLNINSS